MIILNDVILKLQKLQNEGYGNYPVIYSIDDEGNEYHKVICEPDVFKVTDIDEYYLEPGGNIVNCIIIN